MLDAICGKQKEVFKETVRLFPPGFPKQDEKKHELIKNLMSLKEDYCTTLEKAHKKLEMLENNDFDAKLSQNATVDQIN